MKKYWGLALLLSLPVFLFYASHYSSSWWDAEVLPTGFVQTDQASYMANAKEYGERGGFSFCYPLPFSADYNNEAIYAQPQLFMLGQIMRIWSVDPGILLMLFGFLFTVLCIRVCIQLYVEAIGIAHGRFGMVLFIWGGGLICLLGALWIILTGGGWEGVCENPFLLDPGNGWWFLNLGRNFVFPMEAYYHFLFFAMVLSIFRSHYITMLLLLTLLVFSHPFTGTAALLICAVWVLLEKYYIRKVQFPNFVLPALLLLTAAHISYYFLYLRSNADHCILMKQWALDWSMTALNFIPAYILVALLLAYRIASPNKLMTLLSNRFNRFLVVWVVINFLLENHEFALPPHQPLHFTRGYTWSALFLLGYPALSEWSANLRKRFSPLVVKVLLFFGALIFLSDNIIWFSHFGYQQSQPLGGIKINPEQRETLDFLAQLEADDRLLLCRDYHIAYLSTVYTGFRPAYAHRFNTVDYIKWIERQDGFIQRCEVDAALKGRVVIVVYDKERENCFWKEGKLLYEGERYIVATTEL